MEVFDLKGENGVVVGGTGVLGGAIAEGLAAAGAQVAVLGRNRERGAQRVEAIRQAGGKAIFVGSDAGDGAALNEAPQGRGNGLGAGGSAGKCRLVATTPR